MSQETQYPYELESLKIDHEENSDLRVSFSYDGSIEQSNRHMLYINGKEYLEYENYHYGESNLGFHRLIMAIPQGETIVALRYTHPISTESAHFFSARSVPHLPPEEIITATEFNQDIKDLFE